MPNCPICGKEVQTTTQYCPACGTDLRQASASTIMSSSSYRQAGSYPQQVTPIPATGASHSHRKYILAIIGVGLIGLLVGGLIGYYSPVAPDFTTLTGTVTLSSQLSGSPNAILFYASSGGNLSSAVFPNHAYTINLPIGTSYSVSIEWQNVSSATIIPHWCTASPSSFSSSDSNATQNFGC